MKRITRYAANRCCDINRKADLSINMIIIAVLGLLILVVLAFVFSSKINIFGKGVSNCAGICESLNGKSASEVCESLSKDGKIFTYNPGGSCGDDPKKTPTKACCISAFS